MGVRQIFIQTGTDLVFEKVGGFKQQEGKPVCEARIGCANIRMGNPGVLYITGILLVGKKSVWLTAKSSRKHCRRAPNSEDASKFMSKRINENLLCVKLSRSTNSVEQTKQSFTTIQ